MADRSGTAFLDRARRDPAVFAESLVGRPLWPHQLEVARSRARYRSICARRQVGKSQLLAVLALHRAYAVPRSTVLLVSAGETASKRLLQMVADFATASPLLAGSVVDESSKAVTLSNGSQVLSVPASQRQIRGGSIDLLVLDEAGFIDPEIWRAAEPSIIARPGSRVLLSSSPWGGADHFFRQLWQRGMTAPDEMYAAWHWPSSVSPLVDDALLEEIREREEATYFRRENLAEWTDDAGSYFTEAELRAATSDYALVHPHSAEAGTLGGVVGGVDWGFARDANALTVIGARPEPDERGRKRFWLPWVEARSGLPYADWIDHVVSTSVHSPAAGGFAYESLVCETNGVGAMPLVSLDTAMTAIGARGVVSPAWTDAKLKETAFGYLKMLMQSARLELPNEPQLLKQLRGLQFEQLASGGVRIAVPERLGHDDLAMSLALATTAIYGNDLAPVDSRIVSAAEYLDDNELLLADERGWSVSPW